MNCFTIGWKLDIVYAKKTFTKLHGDHFERNMNKHIDMKYILTCKV